jgi:hypothetical protein
MRKRVIAVLILIWLLISFSYYIYLVDKKVQHDYPKIPKSTCSWNSTINLSIPSLNFSTDYEP